MKILKESGFSLLEVLVALAIFGVLLEGLLLLLKQEGVLRRNTTELLHARLIANATMETLQASPFDQLKSYTGKDVSKLQDVLVNVSVSDLSASTLKKIIVTVQWTERNNREKKLTLAAVRSQYPLIMAERPSRAKDWLLSSADPRATTLALSRPSSNEAQGSTAGGGRRP